jgi:hypothetical protein
LVILLTGAKFDSVSEFDIHAKEARVAGIGWDVIRSIPGGMIPEGYVGEEGGEEEEEEEEGKGEEGEREGEEGKEDNDDDEDDDDAGGFSLTYVKERTIPMLTREHRRAHCITPPVVGMTPDEIMEREISIVLFASELLCTNTVCDGTYARTRESLGGRDEALVEITSIVGYYAYVSFTLNVFRIPSIIVGSASDRMD